MLCMDVKPDSMLQCCRDGKPQYVTMFKGCKSTICYNVMYGCKTRWYVCYDVVGMESHNMLQCSKDVNPQYVTML